MNMDKRLERLEAAAAAGGGPVEMCQKCGRELRRCAYSGLTDTEMLAQFGPEGLETAAKLAVEIRRLFPEGAPDCSHCIMVEMASDEQAWKVAMKFSYATRVRAPGE